MTIAWIDTPGAALRSKTEAIDFTASRAVVAISVRYGSSRVEERAYRDGAWLYPYLGSSGPVGGAAGTYRLVRAGGWPSRPTVHVDEDATPTSGQTWGTIYQVDFGTFADATYAPGSVTIDGKQWWLKGSTTPVGTVVMSAGMTAGIGLRITGNFASEGTNNPYLRYFMRLSQIADYNPAAPVALWARLHCDDLANTPWSTAIVGLCEGDESAGALTDAERATRSGIGCQSEGSLNGGSTWVRDATETLPNVHSRGPSGLVYGLACVGVGIDLRNVRPWDPGWTPKDPTSTPSLLTTPNRASTVSARDPLRTGIYVAANFNGGATRNFYLRNLYVMQPKVAA